MSAGLNSELWSVVHRSTISAQAPCTKLREYGNDRLGKDLTRADMMGCHPEQLLPIIVNEAESGTASQGVIVRSFEGTMNRPAFTRYAGIRNQEART